MLWSTVSKTVRHYGNTFTKKIMPRKTWSSAAGNGIIKQHYYSLGGDDKYSLTVSHILKHCLLKFVVGVDGTFMEQHWIVSYIYIYIGLSLKFVNFSWSCCSENLFKSTNTGSLLEIHSCLKWVKWLYSDVSCFHSSQVPWSHVLHIWYRVRLRLLFRLPA